jgi:hypothetical protein
MFLIFATVFMRSEENGKSKSFDDAIKLAVTPKPFKFQVILNAANLAHPKQPKTLGKIGLSNITQCIGLNIADYNFMSVELDATSPFRLGMYAFEERPFIQGKYREPNISSTTITEDYMRPEYFSFDADKAKQFKEILFLLDDTILLPSNVVLTVELLNLPKAQRPRHYFHF